MKLNQRVIKNIEQALAFAKSGKRYPKHYCASKVLLKMAIKDLELITPKMDKVTIAQLLARKLTSYHVITNVEYHEVKDENC